jgi:hypothetical protein
MGGGRPAERPFTVGGSGKSVARCHRTVLAYWKFEIHLPPAKSLQTIGPRPACPKKRRQARPRRGRGDSRRPDLTAEREGPSTVN